MFKIGNWFRNNLLFKIYLIYTKQKYLNKKSINRKTKKSTFIFFILYTIYDFAFVNTANSMIYYYWNQIV